MSYFKMITLAFVLIAISAVQTFNLNTCDLKKTHIDCEITEYKSYVECVRSRMKRSTDCYNSDEEESCENGGCNTSCNDCDCQSCTASQCKTKCNNKCCESCCAFNSCSSNHCCHKTCHTNCYTSSCRSSCRKSCYKAVKSATAANSSNTISNKEGNNITTVIHLNNVINNTNLIDIPINLNNSNVNNMTMDDATNEKSGSIRQQCCNLVEPRQCTPIDTFPYVRCFHLRKQHCGDVCRAPIVHQIPQRYCFNNQNQAQQCQQRTIYVPQPQATNCQYQSGWPFNSCSGDQTKSCTGCYDQYFNPYAGQVSCHSSCYNYGYDRSTLNQQGAWYNRGYQIQMLPYTGQNTGAYPMLNAYGNTNGIPGNILNSIYNVNGGSSTIPYYVIPPVSASPTSNAETNSTVA